MGAAWKHQVLQVGEKVGRRTVIAFAPPKNGRKRIIVRCECGRVNEIWHKLLVAGKADSCHLCAITTHGLSKTPEYKVAALAVKRCDAPHHACDKKNYADRGILANWPGETVGEKAAAMAKYIRETIGPRPSDDHQIDRIDNNLHYQPGNIRWVTRPENCRNKQDNALYEYNGLTLCVAEWAELFEINYFTLYSRLVKQEWDAGDALFEPVRGNRLLTLNGTTLTLTKWAKRLGISQAGLRLRIKRSGGNIEQALTTPVRPIKRSRS